MILIWPVKLIIPYHRIWTYSPAVTQLGSIDLIHPVECLIWDADEQDKVCMTITIIVCMGIITLFVG